MRKTPYKLLKIGNVIVLDKSILLLYTDSFGSTSENYRVNRKKLEVADYDDGIYTVEVQDSEGCKEIDLKVPRKTYENGLWLVTHAERCGESYNRGTWHSHKVTLELLTPLGERQARPITLTARQLWWKKSLDNRYTLAGRCEQTFGPFIRSEDLANVKERIANIKRVTGSK